MDEEILEMHTADRLHKLGQAQNFLVLVNRQSFRFLTCIIINLIKKDKNLKKFLQNKFVNHRKLLLG